MIEFLLNLMVKIVSNKYNLLFNMDLLSSFDIIFNNFYSF